MKHLFFGGVHPADRKELTGRGIPAPAPIPAQVVIPLRQHIGAPCTPLVKPGDTVVITAGVPIGKSGSTNLIKAQIVQETL